MNSPPKRMTRARAAAKASEPSVKTTRIVTAAAKARTAVSSTLTAGTASTAAKRKTRTDENDEEEERRETMARRPRGRPRKVTETQEEEIPAPAPAPVVATRARATATTTTRKPAAAPVKEEPAPAKPTRGRPRKVAPQSKEENAPEPTKQTTRARAATVTKTSTTTATAKPAAKKIVKFQEPDKENVGPASKPKEPATTGLRGRPARRGRATAARSTRTHTPASTSETSEKKPLSPKKVTQIAVPRDDSEDELAMERVPVKQMMKSPIKPPANNKKSEPIPAEVEAEATITVNAAAMLNPPEMNTDTLASPARRPPSPVKESMKSPAKRTGAISLLGSAFELSSNDQTGQTPFKASLFQSAAKRPQSPIKGLGLASAQKLQTTESATKPAMFQSPAKRAIPGLKPLLEPRQPDLSVLSESPRTTPIVVSTPTRATSGRPSQKLMMEDGIQEDAEDDLFKGPIAGPRFSGRLSPVLPRHADPALEEMTAVNEEEEEALQLVDENSEAEDTEDEELAEDDDDAANDQQVPVPVDTEDEDDDSMVLDEIVTEMEESTELPAKTTSQPENPVFQLRQKDMDPCHDLNSGSDSEDDTLPVHRITATPLAQKTPRSRGVDLSVSKKSRRSTMGFTALAEQLGSWSAASPIKATQKVQPTSSNNENGQEAGNPQGEDSPMSNSFFEDDMLIHSEPAAVQKPTFDDFMHTDEDVALAQEANDMSLMESEEEAEEAANHRQSFDSLSDASQEYGDENQVPIDPAILGSQRHATVTPARPLMKSFHTTTKIPLKPADESSPSPLKKRSFSASRVAPKRPSGLSRSCSVISYSPTKERRRSSRNFGVLREEPESDAEPMTPGKTEVWSSMETPARTPRKYVDPSLLRGAIVFVDVHTSEGADASGIFVELLTQMGARCVKSWSWNPSSPTDGESSSKVGITHVVFKDGGKRTLEKVREANGVVQCVGVSWVLDCERENEWLDESPYYIDTNCVPRGGGRRRKSMEPRALANLNGTLVSTPSKDRRQSSPAPITPNRRQSSIWMHTPSDMGGEQEDEEDMEWSKLILTPVPKTPAPEAIARFAAETPSDDDYDEEDETISLSREEMLMRTCPPKAQKFVELGAGILGKDKDEKVLVRLMAARRKSLQFAPKVGSPLARMWRGS